MEWHWVSLWKCWQEILSKKAGLVLTMPYHLSHIKTISVFSIICVLPSWHFRTALYVYLQKVFFFFFFTYIKAVPLFFSKNQGVLMTTSLVVWCSAMLRLSVITHSRYRVPGAQFSANHAGTSLGTVHNITQAPHFRFTSKSPIPASFPVVGFELAMTWMKTLSTHFNHWVDILNQIKNSPVFGTAHQKQTGVLVAIMWAVSHGSILPTEIKVARLYSNMYQMWRTSHFQVKILVLTPQILAISHRERTRDWGEEI